MAKKSEPVNLYQVLLFADKQWWRLFTLTAGNRVDAEDIARVGIKLKYPEYSFNPYNVSLVRKMKP